MKASYSKAFDLYCQAANQGVGGAADRLARLYLAGHGVKRDPAAAAGWIKRAMDLGHTESAELMPRVANVKNVAPAFCIPSGSTATANAKMAPPKEIAKLVHSMAPTYGLDPNLVLAIIQLESSYRVDVVSSRNAQGLMQLIPDTQERFGVKDAFDIQDNLRGGMKYLRWLMAYFQGNVDLVAAAYNSGEGTVERFGGVPPYRETRTYIEKLRLYYTAETHPYQANIARPSSMFARPELAELD